ncbi:MAG: S8 family serine peptidase, partial [Planctomycetota bacterium]
FDLFYNGWLQDDPDDMDPDRRYAGMYGIGRLFQEVYGIDHDVDGDGVPDGVLTRGKTIRVAVIEWAYWGAEPFTDENGNGVYDPPEPFTDMNGNGQHDPGETFTDVNNNGQYDDGEFFIDYNIDGERDTGHEDLDVALEPGQTMIVDTSITGPDHATACLGIIGAREDGDVSAGVPEVGCVGIAPDAELFFFPLTSLEDGPREADAFLSAYEALGPGDIISNSWGPGGNLTTDAFSWVLLRLGTDLGILNFVAAGNGCSNLDELDEILDENGLDSGAVVVGACTPGAPYCRLSFSNHFTDSQNVVHVAAWGSNVTAPGYGSLFRPDGDEYRTYTNSFSGTSSATPQIAGIAACVQ